MSSIVVIGAGIVGLHIANSLRDRGHEVYVLEKEAYLAEHTSGRNSGVIHAGIFYQTGTLKENLCIIGNRLTYEWVEKLKVPHKPCGKWIVPDAGQEKDLSAFYERISRLPIPKPVFKSADAVAFEEPLLKRTDALLIPSTGILDAATYVKSLAAHVENRGGLVILNCRVEEISGQMLVTSRGKIPFDVAINCAGLFADEIAKANGLHDYEVRPCRGDYYVINKSPLARPVYHLPHAGAQGLGVHLTPTFDGQTLLGPNAFFIDKKHDYNHLSDEAPYKESLRYYLPTYAAPALAKAYSGNRPKLFKGGKQIHDFTIIKSGNWIHLLGIESPGLTAAPALAKHVVEMI